MQRHYEETVDVPAPPPAVFEVVDDHARLASHMTRRTWQMGGGKMHVSTDPLGGRAVGSHVRMSGRVLGVPLALDEVVTERAPPRRKTWATVGAPRLVVVGPYRISVEIEPQAVGSRVRVAIDYDMPSRAWLGKLFGDAYARWCVRRMQRDVRAALA